MDADQKWMCQEHGCGWGGLHSELLRAPDPFSPGEEVTACPDCRTLSNTITTACYAPGCREEGSNGTPTTDGYKWHCHKHPPRNEVYTPFVITVAEVEK